MILQFAVAMHIKGKGAGSATWLKSLSSLSTTADEPGRWARRASTRGGDAMSYAIEEIEGIGPKYGKKLRKVGIRRTHNLLDRAASRKGRKELAAQSGVDESLILKWTNMADLMRVRGVGEEYSELLEAAGVDTIKELRTRKPSNLHQAMVDANGKRKLVRQLPGPAQVEKWVAQAKKLLPVMSY
jgi:predicted flap endonuclease-1-like 5' DNA nuclease